jgi:hypothetical protein
MGQCEVCPDAREARMTQAVVLCILGTNMAKLRLQIQTLEWSTEHPACTLNIERNVSVLR